MKNTPEKLLKVLRDPNVSSSFKTEAGKLLESHLWPGWHELPDLPEGPEIPLTIAMATCDDFDGVYFSLQAIRLFHPEILDKVEFLVVDNRPGSDSGRAVATLVESVLTSTSWTRREVLTRAAALALVYTITAPTPAAAQSGTTTAAPTTGASTTGGPTTTAAPTTAGTTGPN